MVLWCMCMLMMVQDVVFGVTDGCVVQVIGLKCLCYDVYV